MQLAHVHSHGQLLLLSVAIIVLCKKEIITQFILRTTNNATEQHFFMAFVLL